MTKLKCVQLLRIEKSKHWPNDCTIHSVDYLMNTQAQGAVVEHVIKLIICLALITFLIPNHIIS
jgi:hypothetical protein